MKIREGVTGLNDKQVNYMKGFAINYATLLVIILIAGLVIALYSGLLGENASNIVKQIFSYG